MKAKRKGRGDSIPIPRLREYRLAGQLSQRQLAARAGVGYNTIWALENHIENARGVTVELLATALGITVEQLRRPLADACSYVYE